MKDQSEPIKKNISIDVLHLIITEQDTGFQKRWIQAEAQHEEAPSP